ncbi:MAG: diguanylate cyclase [Clostridia bacterium]|nr:diguanylate cyclase [Clostridia bacterium]
MKFSLRRKTILLIVGITTIICVLAFIIYYQGVNNLMKEQFKQRSTEIAGVVAVEIDTEKLSNVRNAILDVYDHADNKVMSDQWGTPAFDAYISQFAFVEETEEYQTLRDDLRRMQDVLDVDCLYLSWIDIENGCYIYLIDAAYEDACPPGCIDPIFLDDATVLQKDPSLIVAPNITNTPEYGWLITTGSPIYDSRGEIIAYSAVDISMNDLVSQQNRFLFYITFAFLAMILVVCLIGIIAVNRIVIQPINTLSRAAAQFEHNKKVFSGLNISRKDEIGALAASMKQMEEEIDGYITNLEQTTGDLMSAREQAEQMNRAANIDALTKVRNKRAYDVEVKRLNESTQPYGLLMIDLNELKTINDTYGHEKGDISLVTLCQIICRVFRHSLIYRIGGDEFIVILENDDYEKREELIRSILDTFEQNMRDDSIPPWERVSAAIGFAEFNPKKKERVEQVFQRADAAMYKTKRSRK